MGFNPLDPTGHEPIGGAIGHALGFGGGHKKHREHYNASAGEHTGWRDYGMPGGEGNAGVGAQMGSPQGGQPWVTDGNPNPGVNPLPPMPFQQGGGQQGFMPPSFMPPSFQPPMAQGPAQGQPPMRRQRPGAPAPRFMPPMPGGAGPGMGGGGMRPGMQGGGPVGQNWIGDLWHSMFDDSTGDQGRRPVKSREERGMGF